MKKMTPKEAYEQAKRLGHRCPEVESVLVMPYNRQLKKFVAREEEKSPQMFMYAFAYHRRFIKKSPELVKKEFEADLERNLLKHFLPFTCFMYANLTGRRLPEPIHSRMILETFANDNLWIREYLEIHRPEQKRFEGAFLTKPQEAHNCILDNPGASNDDVAAILRRKGIDISMSTIAKARKNIT